MVGDLASVGFVILSHEADAKLPRLIKALRREYDDAPIAVHHDFGKAPIEPSTLPSDILWVENWERTGWAKWSVVKGALKAFQLLFENTDVQWFFLLSASDYPVKSGVKVRAELGASKFDAYVDARPLFAIHGHPVNLSGSPNPQLEHFNNPAVLSQKQRFYCSPQFWLPILRWKPLRFGKWTYRPGTDGNHPFKNSVSCFYGDHWITINRSACEALLAPTELNKLLKRHFSNRTQADEAFYATALANTKGLRICRNNRRFAEWNGGGAHPMRLTMAELPHILESDAFFARKFDHDDQTLLDAIDSHLGAVPEAVNQGRLEASA